MLLTNTSFRKTVAPAQQPNSHAVITRPPRMTNMSAPLPREAAQSERDRGYLMALIEEIGLTIGNLRIIT